MLLPTCTCRVIAILMLLGAGGVFAQPVIDAPRAFSPYSRTASSITGPIILSRDRIIFGTGSFLDLEVLKAGEVGRWGGDGSAHSAQVFSLSSSPEELFDGNTLCSPGDPATHLVVYEASKFASTLLHLNAYRGPDEPIAGDDAFLCGTYTFVSDTPPDQVITPGDGSKEALSEIGPVMMPEKPEVNPDDPGKWFVSRSLNPLDDSSTLTARLIADEGRSRWGEPITFFARCKSNRTEAYVDWSDYLGDDSSSPYGNWKRVTVRIGDAPAQEQEWDLSTDNEATFAPDWAGDLLKQMVGEERLVLNTTPYSESPITAVFDLRGMRAALSEVASTCNWHF